MIGWLVQGRLLTFTVSGIFHSRNLKILERLFFSPINYDNPTSGQNVDAVTVSLNKRNQKLINALVISISLLFSEVYLRLIIRIN